MGTFIGLVVLAVFVVAVMNKDKIKNWLKNK